MKFSRWTGIFSMALCLFLTSCEVDITVEIVDEDQYEVSKDLTGCVVEENAQRPFNNVEFNENGSTKFYLNLTQKARKNNTVKMVYDPTVLQEYNDKNNASYEAFPQSAVTFENDGLITVATDATKSASMSVSYKSDAAASEIKSYVIPVRFDVVEGDLKMNAEDQTKLIFIKDLSSYGSTAKASGVKIFSCMEINDTNPLNNLSFTLASDGKLLVDALILFSANINYDAETGRVYIFNNENVQHLLDNRDKYLKPLQDRGIKIILSLLGNHDRSGISSLSAETAREFGNEVKAVCDADHLVGIFVDDEYSSYITPPPPGFVAPSNAAAGRLCYEIKKIQPERLMIAYVYSRTRSLPEIDGVPSGEYVDYALHDYLASSDLSSNFPGMPRSNMGLYSQEFNLNRYTSESNLERMRANGYGSHMIFAMDPNRSNFESRQMVAMERIARALFDDELVFDGVKYPKDW